MDVQEFWESKTVLENTSKVKQARRTKRETRKRQSALTQQAKTLLERSKQEDR